MASIQLPAWAHSRKRRSQFSDEDSLANVILSQLIDPTVSAAQELEHSINPLSYPEDVLKQLRLAGLPETAQLPSKVYPNFPHKDIGELRAKKKVKVGKEQRKRRGNETATDGEGISGVSGLEEEMDGEDGEDVDGGKVKRGHPLEGESRKAEAEMRRFAGPMVKAIGVCLDEGDIERAERLYAGFLRLPNYVEGIEGKVDVRRWGMWAVGAEILMRKGERKGGKGKRRWGKTENMGRVREYFQMLILEYPWKASLGKDVMAREFWQALMGVELYDAFVEVQLAWADIDKRVKEGKMGVLEAVREKENVRRRKYREVREVLRPMDELMERLPYSRDGGMNKAYAMLLLFRGDLAVPVAGSGSREEKMRGKKERKELRGRARTALGIVVEKGGVVEGVLRERLRIDQEEEEEEEEDDDDDELEEEVLAEGIKMAEYQDEDSTVQSTSSLPIRSRTESDHGDNDYSP